MFEPISCECLESDTKWSQLFAINSKVSDGSNMKDVPSVIDIVRVTEEEGQPLVIRNVGMYLIYGDCFYIEHNVKDGGFYLP